MDVLHAINGLYACSGFAVGLLIGLTGVGGGSLMTPLLVLLFGFHPATAVGTDLLFAAATKAAGAAVHGTRGTVEWMVVRRLAMGSLPGAALTLVTVHASEVHSGASSHLISVVLGVTLLLTAASLLFRPWILALAARHPREMSQGQVTALTVLTGLVLGALVSLTSVGAGAIGVTALLLLYPRLPTVRVVGSDIAHAVPLTLVAGFGHWLLGTIDWHLLGSLLVGSIPGVVIGSLVAVRVPDLLLRPLLAATLIVAGGKLVF